MLRQIFLCVALSLTLKCALASLSDRYCGRADCYEVLGVTREATLPEIRSAFRKLAQQRHPDKVPDEEKEKATKEFQQINQAYEVLTDENLRKSYDSYRAAPERGEAYHYYNYYKARYLPQTDPTAVIAIALLLFSGMQYMAKKSMNEKAITMIERSDKFKRAVNEMLSENQNMSKEEARLELRKKIVVQGGYSPPKLKDLAFYKIIMVPFSIVRFIRHKIRWYYRYKVYKRPYLPEDQIYITKKLLNITDDVWEYLSEQERQEFLAKELWIPERYKQHIREQLEAQQAQKEAFFNSNKGKKYLRYIKKNK